MFQVEETSRDWSVVTVGLHLGCSGARISRRLFCFTQRNLCLIHKFDLPDRFRAKHKTLKIHI